MTIYSNAYAKTKGRFLWMVLKELMRIAGHLKLYQKFCNMSFQIQPSFDEINPKNLGIQPIYKTWVWSRRSHTLDINISSWRIQYWWTVNQILQSNLLVPKTKWWYLIYQRLNLPGFWMIVGCIKVLVIPAIGIHSVCNF